MDATCSICREPAVGKCSGCKTQTYCGKQCQWIGWNFEDHDQTCGSPAVQPIEGRHGTGHHRGGGAGKPHHVYNKAKWTMMAKESKWTPAQRRYFWWRASKASA